jgi:hypothetical protein
MTTTFSGDSVHLDDAFENNCNKLVLANEGSEVG